MNSSVWKNPIVWIVWCWCLLKANHKKSTFPFNGSDIEILPGQFISGRDSAIKELGTLTPQQWRTAIKYLKSTNRITIKSTNKFSLFTVIKWCEYQTDNQQTNKPLTNEQPATNQPLTTNNNDNNEKNEKKLSAKPKTFSNFRDQRRIEIGKPPMQRKMLTGKVKEVWKELSEIDYEFKRYREKAEEKTGEDYSLLDDGVNPQTRRLMGLAISKTRAKGKTMDDFYEYIFERSEYARKNKYNPLVCLADRMMMDWQLEGIKVKESIEDVARRLLEAARKRGNGDTDESDYRMWARSGMAKELSMTDNDFFDSEEYKKVKHIIGD